MWRRLGSLILFGGTLALQADVCGGLPARPAADANFLEQPRSLSLRLAVKPGGPAFRITIRSRATGESDKPVDAGDIEVAACEDGKRLQLLTIAASQAINFAATFTPADINFDGYLDFSVLGAFGGKWGSYLWWIYDPASGHFVQNELARELGRLRTNGYHVDAKKQEIVTETLMAFCPALTTRYRIEGGRLLKVHEETGNQNIENGCTVTVSDLTGGAMRVSGRRRFVDGKPVH
jgi:hypothetical protein